MQAYKQEFITFMVRAGVLTFGDFTTKSGRKTPYFINTGNYRTGSQIGALGDYYAACIQESGEEMDALFGPAYKGIPLTVAAASSLYRLHGRDLPFCFNRKEEKDHGEGGSLIGHKPKAGERVAIIEDVVTAGTAVRDTVDLFQQIADVKLTALYVSADRMERGTGEKTTIQELRDTLGIKVYPIVTVREIIAFLHNREIDGRVIITDEIREKMEAYLVEYGGRSE
ncbi:MAG: orotate phosphoribosyltransferase [Oscillospiraceae bacterium]|nr:orotate phosphoribosyltransferase [Oscillospiraceae bacterium]